MSEKSERLNDAALVLAFRLALLRDLRPEGALQELIAERIILNNWKLLRGSMSAAVPERLVINWVDKFGLVCPVCGSEPGHLCRDVAAGGVLGAKRAEGHAERVARVECWYDGPDLSREIGKLDAAEQSRYDGSVARQLRRDMETLSSMQCRTVGAAEAPRPARARSSRKSNTKRRR